MIYLKKKIFVLVMLMISVLAMANPSKPKYIFLLIGDGMSYPQRMLAENYSQKMYGKKLIMNAFANQAVTTTMSANSLITDSAAAGTAIACGSKTNNGMIGLLPDGKTKLKSVAVLAKEQGKKVGIITDVTINHATPAAFFGHRESRGMYYELGLDLIASDFDYFGGGGAAKADNKKSPFYKGNLYDLAEKAGYFVSNNVDEIKSLKAKKEQKVWVRASEGAMKYSIDRDKNETELDLAFFTKQAIELLDNDNGFFIMVEGGKIDWMAHQNDAATMLHETLNFNKVVQIAYDFAQKHPGEVLIVVTGDHETGGLTLGFAGTGYKSYIENLQYQTSSMVELYYNLLKIDPTAGFSSVVPILSETFNFAFDEKSNNAIKLTKTEIATLENAFKTHYKDWTKENPKVNNTLVIESIKLFDNRASLAWTSSAHTALPVNTTAYGNGANLFNGMIDNTDIANFLKNFIIE